MVSITLKFTLFCAQDKTSRSSQSKCTTCSTYLNAPSLGLKEVALVRSAVLVVFIVVIVVAEHVFVDVLRLLFDRLVLLLRLLRLSLHLALGLLDLFVLDDVAGFDDFRDGLVIEDLLALLD